MRAEPIAGKKVAREQDIEPFTVKAAMALRMPREMKDAQSAPKG